MQFDILRPHGDVDLHGHDSEKKTSRDPNAFACDMLARLPRYSLIQSFIFFLLLCCARGWHGCAAHDIESGMPEQDFDAVVRHWLPSWALPTSPRITILCFGQKLRSRLHALYAYLQSLLCPEAPSFCIWASAWLRKLSNAFLHAVLFPHLHFSKPGPTVTRFPGVTWRAHIRHSRLLSKAWCTF